MALDPLLIVMLNSLTFCFFSSLYIRDISSLLEEWAGEDFLPVCGLSVISADGFFSYEQIFQFHVVPSVTTCGLVSELLESSLHVHM